VKKGIRKEAAAIVLARLTNEKVAINNGDISSILSSIQSLQQQILDLSSIIDSLGADVVTLAHSIDATNNRLTATVNEFNAHVHAYTDVDNLAVTLNKTTSTPQ